MIARERLERELDDFDRGRRSEALTHLWRAAELGEIALPVPGVEVNLHAHTFFSYNAYGYSPSKFAWLARKAGLAAAGIVDFDVLDGVDEFLEAGRLIGLRTCGSLNRARSYRNSRRWKSTLPASLASPTTWASDSRAPRRIRSSPRCAPPPRSGHAG